MEKQKIVLVTGAAGFIGYHISKVLLDEGWRVVGLDCHNIIFSSSATVHGEPQHFPYGKNHPVAPINPYGRSKLMVEQMLGDWSTAHPERSAIDIYQH
jgi:UDP-glucose 4-epimerase